MQIIKKFSIYYVITVVFFTCLCFFTGKNLLLSLVGVAAVYVASMVSFEKSIYVFSIKKFVTDFFPYLTIVTLLFPLLLFIIVSVEGSTMGANQESIIANLLFQPIELILFFGLSKYKAKRINKITHR